MYNIFYVFLNFNFLNLINENSQSKSSLKIIVKFDLKKKEKKDLRRQCIHNWPLKPFNQDY